MAEVASEATNEAAIGSDSGHVVGIGPAEEQRQQPRTTSGKGTRWERFVEMTCYVCCGVESAADGQTLTATLPRREGERVRGQEAMMTGARPVGEFRSERRGFRRFGGDGWMY